MIYVKLPNIYTGNYSLLVVVPLLLVIISLILIPNVPYGIDLRGGILITLQLSESIDAAPLSQALGTVGVTDASVKTYTNPSGELAEIEISTDERLIQADDKLDEMEEVSDEISAIESTLARLRSEERLTGTDLSVQITQEEGQRAVQLKQARAIEDEVFLLSESLAGRKLSAEKATADEIRKIQKASSAAFSEAKEVYKQGIVDSISKVTTFESYSLEEVSPTLSRLFIAKIGNVAIISIVLAIVGVFVIFRVPIPSIAIIVGATCDIILALGAMAVFQIPLTLASFATLMMLVGLSLDTDMMLTIKTVKRREGTPVERTYDAFRTGFTMTTTLIVAFSVLLILGIVTHIPTYFQIGAVAFAGLIGDLIATWMLNSVLILWYLEGKYDKFLSMVKR